MNDIKTCSKCGEVKSINEFCNNKNTKDGKHSHCKECRNKGGKIYRMEHKEEAREYGLKYRTDNKKYFKQYKKMHYIEHKKEILNKCKNYQEKNRIEIAKRKKKYRQKNIDRIKKHDKEYHENNKDKRKKYLADNKGKIAEYHKKYILTDACKKTRAKSKAKRKRELGYVPLNNIFPGCHGHHVDTNYVIHIPAEMHKSINHQQNKPETMIEINKLAFGFLQNESK